MDLSDKKVLITGGSRGIGAAIAKRFAKNGADVAITYNASSNTAENVVQDIQSYGCNGFAVQADAAKPENLKDPLESAIHKLGGLDILVNNAGIGRSGSIEDISLEDFDETLNVNVRSVFQTVQICQKHMSSGGRIILIGSILGERAIFESITSYNTSKFAVAGIGRSLAHDLGPRNITVNIIQPGPIDTEMNPADGDDAQEMIDLTALGRYGRADEVAALACFLASNESSYITGATINIDGGANA